MNLLTELIRDYVRLDPEQSPDEDIGNQPLEDQLDDFDTLNDTDVPDDVPQPQDLDPEAEDAIEDITDAAIQDPDRQGLIRTVKGAHLVYKRETEDGTFEELWVYNSNDMRQESETKRAILSGTDIPPNKLTSPDGSQSFELWASGNVEMMIVRGLPS